MNIISNLIIYNSPESHAKRNIFLIFPLFAPLTLCPQTADVTQHNILLPSGCLLHGKEVCV